MAAMESAPTPVGTTAHGPHSTLPASPTLTNPDMILPDYDRSPSPVRLDDRSAYLQSSGNAWRNSQLGPSLENMHAYNMQSHHFNGFSSAAPVTPITPIIYGNGTMLSDIGEVTEVESTPGKPSPPSRRRITIRSSALGLQPDDSEAHTELRTSPTMAKSGVNGGVKKRAKELAAQRERRSSSDSTSTITDHDHAAVIKEFDDAISLGGDSVFQGDDEESMASSYVDDSSSLADAPFQTGAKLSSPFDRASSGHKYTTAQLSRRAEQILANAKKRLTTMEDNLSRARSSLIVTSPCSDSSMSTPSPPIVRASSALIMSTTTGSSAPAPGHHRIGSDNSLRIGLPIKVYPQRSSSVLGVSNGPRQQPLTVSKSADQLHGQYNRQRTSYIMREALLEPLGEDETAKTPTRDAFGIADGYSSTMNPAHDTSNQRVLSRSASVTQMRDIKHQVKDLKGKISSLREQARADSLKRRSLQTLRTPSPFTHSQISQWYIARPTDAEPISEDTSPERSPLNAGVPISGDDRQNGEGDVQFGSEGEAMFQEEAYIGTEETLEDGSDQFDLNSPDVNLHEFEAVDAEAQEFYEEAYEDEYDMVSESGESIYHETVQHPLSHEDREDAFDYEHFFLHSAMGTLSQRTARRDSYSSEGSIETARGPLGSVPEEDDLEIGDGPGLVRRGSERSFSTTGTFETAEEGMSSRSGSLELIRGDEEEREEFPELSITDDAVDRQSTSSTATRTGFADMSPQHTTYTGQNQEGQRTSRQESIYSALRRKGSSTVDMRSHRPSVSSVGSTGTTRSFPLVNRGSKVGSRGTPTPESSSTKEQELKINHDYMARAAPTQNDIGASRGHNHSISMHSTDSSTSLIEKTGTTAVLETLPKDDQFLVERLVASLGRCVLGLTETGRASPEARMYRRRIDAARKILEGIEMPR